MFYSYLKVVAVIAVVSMTSSRCATIVSKSSYPVSVATTPSGAQVSITDKKGKEIFKGKTPTVVRLKAGAGFFSRAEYQVRINSQGYDEKVIPVTFKLNGWYFGNIVFGGLIGMLIVDPASGAMWKIDRYSDDINEVLSKSTVSTEPTLRVIDINELPESLKKSLIPLK